MSGEGERLVTNISVRSAYNSLAEIMGEKAGNSVF